MLVLTPNIFIGEVQKLKTYEGHDTGVQNEQIEVVFLQIFSLFLNCLWFCSKLFLNTMSKD